MEVRFKAVLLLVCYASLYAIKILRKMDGLVRVEVFREWKSF
jgi:hypothetical protein